MSRVLFVCTGNIFRSMTADLALNALVSREKLGDRIRVGSAGIEAKPQTVHPLVVQRLKEHGLDPTHHQQRRLTSQLLSDATLCLAMGRDHQQFIEASFATRVPLLNAQLFGRDEPVLDVWEAVPDWQTNRDAAAIHTLAVVDYLVESMPILLSQLHSTLESRI